MLNRMWLQQGCAKEGSDESVISTTEAVAFQDGKSVDHFIHLFPKDVLDAFVFRVQRGLSGICDFW